MAAMMRGRGYEPAIQPNSARPRASQVLGTFFIYIFMLDDMGNDFNFKLVPSPELVRSRVQHGTPCHSR